MSRIDTLTWVLLIYCWFFSIHKGSSQFIQNGAMEGSQLGDNNVPDYWHVCSSVSSPHLYREFIVGDTSFFSHDGSVFCILKTRDGNDTYPATTEHLYTKLMKPLEKGNCYALSVYLRYTEHGFETKPTLPVKFQIWGGTEPCLDENNPDNFELLYSSDTIGNKNWEKFTFGFTVNNNTYDYLYVRPYWDFENIDSNYYYGIIFIDNMDIEYIQNSALPIIDSNTYYFKYNPFLNITADSAVKYIWDPAEAVDKYESRSVHLLAYTDTLNVKIYNEYLCPLTIKYPIIYSCDSAYKNWDPFKGNLYFAEDRVLRLNASEGKQHNWNNRDMLINYTGNSPEIIIKDNSFNTDSIVFIDSITDNWDCEYIEVFNLIKNCDTIRQRDIIFERSVYYHGEPLYLNGSEGKNHYWQPAEYLSDNTSSSPLFEGYKEDFKELIRFTDSIDIGYGCIKFDIINLIRNCDTIYPNKQPVIKLDTTVYGSASITLKLDNSFSARWMPLKNIKCIDNSCNEVIITPDATTLFKVDITDDLYCLRSEVYKITVLLVIPNVITPNGDQMNDEFRIPGLPERTNICIFDKIGNIVYTKDDYGKNGWWDGKNFNGEYVEGTYWYVLKFSESAEVLKGYVLVIR